MESFRHSELGTGHLSSCFCSLCTSCLFQGGNITFIANKLFISDQLVCSALCAKAGRKFWEGFSLGKERIRCFANMLWHNLLLIFVSQTYTDSYSISGIPSLLFSKFNNLLSGLSLKHL